MIILSLPFFDFKMLLSNLIQLSCDQFEIFIQIQCLNTNLIWDKFLSKISLHATPFPTAALPALTGTMELSDHLHFVCLSSFGCRAYLPFTHLGRKIQVLPN